VANTEHGTGPTFVVACIQMEPRIGEKQSNLARSIERIEQAARQGASLVVLPELANTGYMFTDRREAFELAEPVPDGESTRTWIDVAARLGIYVVAGIAERDGDRLFNSAVVIGPKGYVGTFRKLHLWNDENTCFEPGDKGVPVFDTELGRIAVAICYDGWFPEVYRLAAAKGADIICVPTNWVPMPGQVAGGMAMANMLAIAAAHSNGVVIACADRVGTERGQEFIGQSLIVDSDGWLKAGPASAQREEILFAECDVGRIRSSRRINAFNHKLRDRRTDVYDPMLGSGETPASV
jgi:N-carbamoylputrescine amidase